MIFGETELLTDLHFPPAWPLVTGTEYWSSSGHLPTMTCRKDWPPGHCLSYTSRKPSHHLPDFTHNLPALRHNLTTVGPNLNVFIQLVRRAITGFYVCEEPPSGRVGLVPK